MQFTKRPEKTLTLQDFDLPLSPKETRRVFAYLLRSTVKRVSKDSVGEHRYSKLAGEVASQLMPLITRNQNALSFYTALCNRFSVDATGSDTTWGPIETWLPEGALRWDRTLLLFDYSLLRTIIEESPNFLATFARSHGDEHEDADFLAFPDPIVAPSTFIPTLPAEAGAIIPHGFHTVWTLKSDLHHGADSKTGNVSMFRRHDILDPLTGKCHQVPFISGNAIRGQWRDLVMGRYLSLLGLKSTDIPPMKAHALLAGGSVEQGADGAQVNNVIRKTARDLCPAIDLLGGNIDQQIMSGRARVGDALLVCRENAFFVKDAVAPSQNLGDFQKSLPEAAAMTVIRQGTRQRHSDLEGGAGVQMLFNQEVVPAGNQFVHTLQLWSFDTVNPITASCLNDLLGLFQQVGTVGASTARGFGSIIFDPYKASNSSTTLPSSDLYLEYVTQHKEAMVEWLMSSPVEKPKKASKRAVTAETTP